MVWAALAGLAATAISSSAKKPSGSGGQPSAPVKNTSGGVNVGGFNVPTFDFDGWNNRKNDGFILSGNAGSVGAGLTGGILTGVAVAVATALIMKKIK